MAKGFFRRVAIRCSACLLALLLLSATYAAAATQPEFVIRFGWIDPLDPADPMKQFTSAYAVSFKTQLEMLSGERIRVDLYPSAQLGDHRSSIEQMAGDTLEMCNVNLGVLASLYYDKLSVLNMPFLFTSRAHANRTLSFKNDFMREMVEECAEECNIRLIAIMAAGPRIFANNIRPLRAPADLKGIKMRTMEVVPHIIMVEALGGIPTPMPMTEVYTSLQTRVIDGEDQMLQNLEAAKHYQVVKYVSLTNHVMDVSGTAMSDKFYRRLPEDLRAALIEADQVAQASYHAVGTVYDYTGPERLKGLGMEVNYITPEAREQFKSIALPAVRKKVEEDVGPEFVAKFLQEVDKAQRSFLDDAKVK
ncbi:MAG: TRAP transporter substrate-binding protein [Planctomycetota bacterium]|nr:TRAP transporter substrate-binding protein [Planctomycetota bacterium]